jgi:hypothetical protein
MSVLADLIFGRDMHTACAQQCEDKNHMLRVVMPSEARLLRYNFLLTIAGSVTHPGLSWAIGNGSDRRLTF